MSCLFLPRFSVTHIQARKLFLPFGGGRGSFLFLYRNRVDLGCLHAAVAPSAKSVWPLGFAAVFLLATNAKSQSFGVWMTPREFEEALACLNWSRMLQSTWKKGALLSKGLWQGICWGYSTAPSRFSHGCICN